MTNDDSIRPKAGEIWIGGYELSPLFKERDDEIARLTAENERLRAELVKERAESERLRLLCWQQVDDSDLLDEKGTKHGDEVPPAAQA